MTKSSPLVAALALAALAACNETPTTPAPAVQHGYTIACDPTVDSFCGSGLSVATPSDTIPYYEHDHTIVLGDNAVMLFLANVDASALNQNPTFAVATVSGPSDTIPAPAPPGPVQAAYRQLGAHMFTAIYQAAGVKQGLLGPSDTIPGPAPSGNVKVGRFGGYNVAVWVSTKQLSDSKAISTSTTALKLVMKVRGKTLTSAPVSVGIIGPERNFK